MEHFLDALKVVRTSVDKEVEDTYRQLSEYFSTARAKEIKYDKFNYFV